MIDKAIVAGISEKWIDCLSLDERERAHDESCGGGGSCGSGGCHCRVSGQPFRAARPRNIEVKVGDTVEISAAPARAMLASLFILGIPVLAGVGGWIAADRIAPGLGEGAKAAVAGGGLTLGVALTVLVGSRGKNDRLPEIIAVRS